MGLAAFWTVVDITTSIRTLAAHHLLHFFSLYLPYLPPREVIIAIPIAVVCEYILYREFRPIETVDFSVAPTSSIMSLEEEKMSGCYTVHTIHIPHFKFIKMSVSEFYPATNPLNEVHYADLVSYA
jgi:hypothetical protein